MLNDDQEDVCQSKQNKIKNYKKEKKKKILPRIGISHRTETNESSQTELGGDRPNRAESDSPHLEPLNGKYKSRKL
jgi:hypothetical protein